MKFDIYHSKNTKNEGKYKRKGKQKKYCLFFVVTLISYIFAEKSDAIKRY